MTSNGVNKSRKFSQEQFDTISNKIGVFLAQRESLIKSWNVSSSLATPAKTIEELDAEDAAIFSSQPKHFGVGAQIPSEFLVGEVERNNNKLRTKLLASKGSVTRKSRDADEKVSANKRISKDDSSDEELGRSSLGRAKRLKCKLSEDSSQKTIDSVNGKL